MAKRRKPGAWVPGQSGNPSGRPKKNREVEALAQLALENKDGSNKAIDGLVAMAMDPENTPRDRKAAWELLLAYGYGKPRQRIEATVETLTHEQALELIE